MAGANTSSSFWLIQRRIIGTLVHDIASSNELGAIRGAGLGKCQ